MSQMRRRLGPWRPVGAVACPRCGENRHSGGYQTIVDGRRQENESRLMCDACRRTFVEWYRARADEDGWVTQ